MKHRSLRKKPSFRVDRQRAAPYCACLASSPVCPKPPDSACLHLWGGLGLSAGQESHLQGVGKNLIKRILSLSDLCFESSDLLVNPGKVSALSLRKCVFIPPGNWTPEGAAPHVEAERAGVVGGAEQTPRGQKRGGLGRGLGNCFSGWNVPLGCIWGGV